MVDPQPLSKHVDDEVCRVARNRETVCHVFMMIPRLVEIGLKKYHENPQQPFPAVSMIVRNAVRLALQHLGREETVRLLSETVAETKA